MGFWPWKRTRQGPAVGEPRRLSIHIGAPKTGSTAIQAWLDANRVELGRRGVRYPDVCLRGHGHHDLAFLLGGGYPAWATPQPRPLESLADDLDRALVEDVPHVILSSEDFYLYPAPRALAALLGRTDHGRRITIYCYVRRQDEMALSWYNQAVKAQGFGGSFAECEAETRPLWDYSARLEPWASVFGAGQVEVRAYRPDRFAGGDVCADFATWLGIPSDGLPAAPEVVNTNLLRDILEFQRQVNRLPMPVEAKRAFHRDLIALSREPAARGLFLDTALVGPGGRAEILRYYRDSNERLAERWFAGQAPFSPLIADGPEPPAHPPLDGERLQMLVGWLLARRVAPR